MEEAIALDSIQAIAASFGASFDAEKIVDTVLEKDGTRYYKVRWVKYSWEPAASFTHLEHLIGEFWNQYGQGHTQELHPHAAKRIRDSKHLSMSQEIPPQVSIQQTQGNRPLSTILTTLSSLDPIVGNVTQTQSGLHFQSEITGNFSHLSNLGAAAHHGNHHEAEMIPSMQQMMHVVGTDPTAMSQADLSKKIPKKPRLPRAPKVPKEKKIRLPGEAKKPRKKVPGNCPICGKYFKSTTNIAAHKKLHTEERQHECPQCHRKFRRKLHLRRHLESHAGIKNYSCNICGAAFSSKWYMEAHAVIHTGAKPYQCETCEKRFNNKANLNKHKLIHQGKRPFVCNICGHSYRQSYDLKRHMGTHTADKDYRCDYCNKSFARKTYLQRHLVTHKGERKFECKLCDRKFFQKGHLSFHMKHHNNKDKKERKDRGKKKVDVQGLEDDKVDNAEESSESIHTTTVTTSQMDVLQQAAQSCMEQDEVSNLGETFIQPLQSGNQETQTVGVEHITNNSQAPGITTRVISKDSHHDMDSFQSRVVPSKNVSNNFSPLHSVSDVKETDVKRLESLPATHEEANYFSERNNPILEFPPPSHDASSGYM